MIVVLLLVYFNDSNAQVLRSYHITCDPDSFQYIIDNPAEDIYIDCVFEYDNIVWDDARIRLRGNSSRWYPKKSYKINFDGNNPFLERDKINLISEYTDPTFSREYLSYDFYQRAGLPASQTWFCRLYVNDAYLGLYLDVEQVDELFLAHSGLPETASVYKASEYGALLSPQESLENLWKKETNISTGFYDLENLVEWLASTPDDQFFDQLGNLFSTSELARVIAVNSMIANQSTYYHNYYLIHDMVENGLWSMIPWDMDKTFIYGGNSKYFRSGHQMLSVLNALISRCWRDDQMRSVIFEQFYTMMDSFFIEPYYQTLTDSLLDLLYDAVLEDTMKQFTVEDFVTTLSAIPGLVANRRNEIDLKVNSYPLPFDFNSAILTPDGVYFSWDETTVMNGSNVEYKILLAQNSFFTSGVIEIPGITGTSLLYNQLEPGNYYWKVYADALQGGGSTRSLKFFQTLTISEGAFSGTEVTGVIDSSQTWNLSASPYSLPEGLTIAPGAALTIEPGVVVGVGLGQSIVVQGSLSAAGSLNDSVRFVALNPAEPWGALIFADTDQESFLDYVSLGGGSDDVSGPCPGSMIQIANSNVVIDHSSIHYGSMNAVSAWYADIHLENCKIEHFQRSLLNAQGGSVILRSCSFVFGDMEQTGLPLLTLSDITDGLEISACEFINGSGNALQLNDLSSGEISGNKISGFTGSGVFIGQNTGEIGFTNNLITNNNTGLTVSEDSYVSFFNNLIAFNNVGISVINSTGGLPNSNARNMVVWENDTEILIEPGAQFDIAYSLIRGGSVFPGAGNLNSDPQFIDLWNENFLPEFDSPLIDAGYGDGSPNLDYAGNPRIDVPAIPNTGVGEIPFIDIGLFEFNPGIYANDWLYINEFMADNENTIADPQGEYDDWIEIWNGGAQPQNLAGLHLTDNFDEPDKWEFPDTTLEVGAFILIWADNDEGFPGIHTNFRLSAGGEEIGLFSDVAGGLMLFDSVSFASQQPDVSSGRAPDGANQWQPFSTPTPGYFNLSDSLPPGPLSGVLTGGIYLVVGDIFVASNDSLIMEPGACFIFAGDYTFDINGYLHAVGTPQDSIRFLLKSGVANWGGIKFNSSADNTSKMEFCSVTGGYAGGSWPDNCGGGITIWNSNPAISHCTVAGNSSLANGGGIFCGQNAMPVIKYCLITGNSAIRDGGGIYIDSSNPLIVNCTICDNSADIEGGGLFCKYSEAVITNSIIAGNYGQGGMHFGTDWNGTVTYNDFHNNQYTNLGGMVPLNLGQITGVNANNDPCDDCNNIFLNPVFYSTAGDSAYLLTANSPCIDAGDPYLPPDPDDTVSDMGANYYHHLSFVLEPIDDLIITVVNSDVYLSWDEQPSANYYVVYRSSLPYFDPAAATFLGEVTQPEFCDYGAVASSECFFYRVIYVVVVDSVGKTARGE